MLDVSCIPVPLGSIHTMALRFVGAIAAILPVIRKLRKSRYAFAIPVTLNVIQIAAQFRRGCRRTNRGKIATTSFGQQVSGDSVCAILPRFVR